MILFDQTFPTPQENLACDEALLEWREKSGGEEILRFWQAQNYFAVLGYTNKLDAELNLKNCECDGVPVLRRVSGGGTVLHGTGSLCYALVLQAQGEFHNLTSTNHFVMEKMRAAIAPLVAGKVEVRGTTDLALDNRKFSGNAQRRKKNWLLFHGTFLLNFDVQKIEDYLRFPPIVPDYRAARNHADFVTNLHVETDEVKAAIADIWNARKAELQLPTGEIQKLVQDRYSSEEWTRRF